MYLHEVCTAIHELPTYLRKNLSAVYYSASVWGNYVERTCLQSTTLLLYELPTLEDLVCSLLQCYCMSYQWRKTLSAFYYSATVWATYAGRTCLQSTTVLCISYLYMKNLSAVFFSTVLCRSYLSRKNLSAVYYSATVWATYVERTCLQSTTVLLYELPMQEELVWCLLQHSDMYELSTYVRRTCFQCNIWCLPVGYTVKKG
jgi:hypothetical protein